MKDTAPLTFCSIDWCYRPVKSRGWCQMHYFRWRRGGDMDAPPLPTYDSSECSIEGCDKPRTGGVCPMHRSRIIRNGSPHALRGPRSMKGPNNPNWKGNNIGYTAAHDRLRRRRGNAPLCELCPSIGPYHWALNWTLNKPFQTCPTNGLAFSTDPEDYIPLCVSCHKSFDLEYSKTVTKRPCVECGTPVSGARCSQHPRPTKAAELRKEEYECRKIVTEWKNTIGNLCAGIPELNHPPHHSTQLSVDHLKPVSQGGTLADGYRVVCLSINSSRGAPPPP